MLVQTSVKPNLVLISKLNSYLNYRVYYLKKQQLTSFLGFNPIFFWNLYKFSSTVMTDKNEKKASRPFLLISVILLTRTGKWMKIYYFMY